MSDGPKHIRWTRHGDLIVDGYVMIGGGGENWWTPPATPYWHYDFLEELEQIEPKARGHSDPCNMPMPAMSREERRRAIEQAIGRTKSETPRP